MNKLLRVLTFNNLNMTKALIIGLLILFWGGVIGLAYDSETFSAGQAWAAFGTVIAALVFWAIGARMARNEVKRGRD